MAKEQSHSTPLTLNTRTRNTMRSLLLLSCLAMASALLVAGAPQDTLCPSLPVQLELRTSPTMKNKFQLVFAAIDPTAHPYQSVDFVDIHYRINNENSVNLRVATSKGVTDENEIAKQAQVDGITLLPGDAIRAYATYSAKGYACDTPIHTFNAPELDQLEQLQQPIRTQQPFVTRRGDLMQTMAVPVYARGSLYRPYRSVDTFGSRRSARDIDLDFDFDQQQQLYMTQAATEDAVVGACPSIPLDQDIMKVAGLDNTYVLSFENRNPRNQLAYVDLHLSTDAAKGWDNLRLGSDMQLSMAHKVLQPGVVILPHEALKWYWSYRTIDAATGQAIDCTTPVSQITPQEVQKQISIAQLNKAAQS